MLKSLKETKYTCRHFGQTYVKSVDLCSNWVLTFCWVNFHSFAPSASGICSWRVAARTPGFQLTLAAQLRKRAINPLLSLYCTSKTSYCVKQLVILHFFHLLLSELPAELSVKSTQEWSAVISAGREKYLLLKCPTLGATAGWMALCGGHDSEHACRQFCVCCGPTNSVCPWRPAALTAAPQVQIWRASLPGSGTACS